jgi:hypothetical protein
VTEQELANQILAFVKDYRKLSLSVDFLKSLIAVYAAGGDATKAKLFLTSLAQAEADYAARDPQVQDIDLLSRALRLWPPAQS